MEEVFSTGLILGSIATVVISAIRGLLARLKITLDRKVDVAVSIIVCYALGLLAELYKNGGNLREALAQGSVIFTVAHAAYEFVSKPATLSTKIASFTAGKKVE